MLRLPVGLSTELRITIMLNRYEELMHPIEEYDVIKYYSIVIPNQRLWEAIFFCLGN
jgi:hypothetical protein